MENTVIIQGRFTKEPEVKNTASGATICSFQLACDRKTKDKQTDFIPFVSFGKTAEFISKYFHKGEMAIVNGQLQSRNYEAQDGSKRTAYEVYVNSCSFCGAKPSGGNSEPQRSTSTQQEDYDAIDWDAIPDLPDSF